LEIIAAERVEEFSGGFEENAEFCSWYTSAGIEEELFVEFHIHLFSF
jgi:hypothetical protein